MFRGNKIFKVDRKGNKKRVFFIPGLFVRFKGKNAAVTVSEPYPKFDRCTVRCGDNADVRIGSSGRLFRRLNIYADGESSVCHIGDDFSTHACSIFIRSKIPTKVVIGTSCMFARNVTLRTSDSHSVVDIETGETINTCKDIIIGNHCWLGDNTTVLKGVNIADNCIIGYGSLVTKNCEPNSAYGGVPAKLLKSGVNWERQMPGEQRRY